MVVNLIIVLKPVIVFQPIVISVNGNLASMVEYASSLIMIYLFVSVGRIGQVICVKSLSTLVKDQCVVLVPCATESRLLDISSTMCASTIMGKSMVTIIIKVVNLEGSE